MTTMQVARSLRSHIDETAGRPRRGRNRHQGRADRAGVRRSLRQVRF